MAGEEGSEGRTLHDGIVNVVFGRKSEHGSSGSEFWKYRSCAVMKEEVSVGDHRRLI